jgi:hypothetical protein
MTALAQAVEQEAQPDARAELDEVIARHTTLVAKAEAAHKALDACEEAILLAAEKLEKAKKVAAEAPAAMAKHQVDSMVGVKTRPPISPQAANDALARAEDELAALRSYREELTVQRQKARDSRDFTAMRVRDKRAVVLRDSEEVAVLVERYEATRLAYHQLEITLQRIDSVGGIPPAHRSADLRHLKPDPAWMAALEALLTDADAALPD